MDYASARDLPTDGTVTVRTIYGDMGTVIHKQDITRGQTVMFTLYDVRDKFGNVVPCGGGNYHVHSAKCWPVAPSIAPLPHFAPRAD
jgi:hypothetical protein